MRPRILLINPWIQDFAAFSLWARPLGLLRTAEYLSAFEADLLFIDCAESFRDERYGTGKYRSERIQKPALLQRVPRYYKRYGMRVEDFEARLKSLAPFNIVLMTSIMAYWYPGVQEAIRIVKKAVAEVPVILGGIYPTLYPEHAFRYSGADAIYTGPVNDRLLSILHDCGVELSRARKRQPYYDLNLYRQHPFAPVLTSTGCPFHCSYCASGSLAPHYERRPHDEIIAEIRELYGRGVRDFAFYDDALLFNANRHIKPLLESLLLEGIDVRFHAPNGLHARFIDEELARMMKKAGFTTIRLSLETVDGARQEMTGGKITTGVFEKIVRTLQKQGFTHEHIGAYLLYGLPDQGLEELEEGIGLLKGLHVRIHLAEFSPIRGTACWDDLVKRGVIPDDLDPLLTNNTVFSLLYSGYGQADVHRIKIKVKEYNLTCRGF
jgi:radical SAM superfamily enzyme YgiQ (UPF0313 family)